MRMLEPIREGLDALATRIWQPISNVSATKRQEQAQEGVRKLHYRRSGLTALTFNIRQRHVR